MKYKVCKVDREKKFNERNHCPHCRITAFPLLLSPFNPVFRRSIEVRSAIEDRFQNRSPIVDRQANSECQNKRKEPDLALPGFRMKFPLRTKIENGGRYC